MRIMCRGSAWIGSFWRTASGDWRPPNQAPVVVAQELDLWSLLAYTAIQTEAPHLDVVPVVRSQMNLNEVLLSPLTESLLRENGRDDCGRGIDKYTGWQEVATAMGFDASRRTPAQEAYFDGYYSGSFGSKKAK